jgi:2-polyprenyl-3-methyl-5-hydroxy-6-metoxy-1,4-benzoquinol methylase
MELLSIVLLTCLFLWILLAIFIVWSWLNTPWYPSRLKELEEVWKSGEFELPENAKFIDLGSGDGRIVNWAASKGFDAHGIEMNPYLSLTHRIKRLFNKNKKNISIYNKNFFNHNFSDYDVVYLYVFPKYMNKLKSKLYSELKPGSIIISNVFSFSDVKPDQEIGRFKIYRVN